MGKKKAEIRAGSDVPEQENVSVEKAETAAKKQADKKASAKKEKDKKEERKKQPADHTEDRVRQSIQTRLETLMAGGDEQRTAQAVADGTGISRAAVRKYMLCMKGGSSSAVPSAVAICRLADYFGVSPNYILGYTEEDGAEKRMRGYDDARRLSGLSMDTLKKLSELRDAAAGAENGDTVMSALDRIIFSAADELMELMKEK